MKDTVEEVRVLMWPIRTTDINDQLGELVSNEWWRRLVVRHEEVVEGASYFVLALSGQTRPLSVDEILKIHNFQSH